MVMLGFPYFEYSYRGLTMTATNHNNQLGEIYQTMLNMSLTVHLALVFHVFIAVAVII